MDNDILFQAATAYKDLMKYKYILTLGDSKRKVIISIISSEKHSFTHTSGLDHLSDIPEVFVNSKMPGANRRKMIIFERILKKEITYDTISESKKLHEPLGHRRNIKSFTIHNRIEYLKNIKIYFDNIGENKGEIRKWDSSHSNSKFISYIQADYVLVTPIDSNVNMYCFLVQTNRNASKDQPIELTLISAFPDVKEFILSNQKFTILEEKRIDIKTSEEILLFRHKRYQPTGDMETSNISDNNIPFPKIENKFSAPIIEENEEEYIPHRRR